MWQKLTSREKKLLILLGIVICISFPVRFFILGQLPQFVELKSEVEKHELEVAASRSLSKKLPELLNKSKQAQLELTNLEARLNTSLQTGMPILEVGKRAGEVKLLGVYPGEIVEKQGYLILPMQLKLRGEYLEVLEYIRKLENMPAASEIVNPNIKSTEQKGVVTAELILNLFGTKLAQVTELKEQWILGKYDVFRPTEQISAEQDDESVLQEDNVPAYDEQASQGIENQVQEEPPLNNKIDQGEEPGIRYDFPVR